MIVLGTEKPGGSVSKCRGTGSSGSRHFCREEMIAEEMIATHSIHHSTTQCCDSTHQYKNQHSLQTQLTHILIHIYPYICAHTYIFTHVHTYTLPLERRVPAQCLESTSSSHS